MGTSKTNQYANKTMQFAQIASALAHPTRLLIIEKLAEENYIRSGDLAKMLRLSKSSIYIHVQKLVLADLVKVDFFPDEYRLSLKPEKLASMSGFFGSRPKVGD